MIIREVLTTTNCLIFISLYNDNAAFDCLFFTESWLHANFPDSLLNPVVRKDRHSDSGGGVCTLISKSLRCVALEQFSLSDDVYIVCLP